MGKRENTLRASRSTDFPERDWSRVRSNLGLEERWRVARTRGSRFIMEERRGANRRYVYTSRPACGDMADSEGEFLGESFDDKEDLDRFKIPISGVSRGVNPPSATAAPLGEHGDEVEKRCWHIALKGVKQCLSNILVK